MTEAVLTPAKKPTAIAGVSASTETTVMEVFPSIACTSIGQGMGSVFESVPVRIFGIKLSHLLFVLPLSPVAALVYLLLKVSGERYVLTNRSLQTWSGLGTRRISQVPLEDIEDITVTQEPGQVFYRAGDIYLIGKTGQTLAKLGGIPYAPIFRQTILEARDARRQVVASLDTIRKRPA
ncbi:MAG TPA: PH domain-containing protein [Planctomycetaceae bacterium]|nr:PH domain-containing protein [Planctomycetaceae bacterium]